MSDIAQTGQRAMPIPADAAPLQPQTSLASDADWPGAGGADVSDAADPPGLGETLDRAMRGAVAELTGGLSPAALAAAYLDWAVHFAASPGKQAELVVKGWRKTLRFLDYAWRSAGERDATEPCIEPLPQDKRFAGESWRHWPYDLVYQGFLLNQQWWHNATTGVRGVSAAHERMVEFGARQLLDMVAPSNFIAGNPEVLRQTVRHGGANLLHGLQHMLEDAVRNFHGQRPAGADAFRVGENIAATPGKVIYRNHLIELIQYAPATDAVRPEPVLIVPAWIMKYYILDLSPENSLVRYLTAQGFTVFMISWRNPGAEDRALSLEDYRRQGPMAALEAIGDVVPAAKVHLAGYCLGGTLAAVAAAAMARDGDDRLASLTLLAAQTDFTEAGELMLFISESQIAFLEDLMWQNGYLDTRQMAGAFQWLRSNDLVWSRLVHDYLMGERAPMIDLMAWNADATRMPARMHGEYLRRLFLNNDLAEGRYIAGGRPVTLADLQVPIFAVGTEHDHVAPWRSTYKIDLLCDAEVTYVLTSGGHNAGIVSEPGHDGRHYRLAARGSDQRRRSAEEFFELTPAKDGSWWPAWTDWLSARSGEAVAPPSMGAADAGLMPICDAPGSYVLQH